MCIYEVYIKLGKLPEIPACFIFVHRHDMIVVGTKFLMDANGNAPTWVNQTLCPMSGESSVIPAAEAL